MHHNNYYFIRQLSEELSSTLLGAELIECYSQNKDELVLGFALADTSDFYIVANLGTEFSSLYFPKDLHRAKRNTITLFEELIGYKIQSIYQYENERAFALKFEHGFDFVFKLFGTRSNCILFKNNEVLKIFKNSLKQDKTFIPSNKNITITQELIAKESNLRKVVFTFDDLFIDYLEKTKGYGTLSTNEKYKIITELLQELNQPQFYITRVKGKVVLSVVPVGEVMQVYTKAIEAINAFYSAHFRYNHLAGRKEKIGGKINAFLKSTSAYIEKTFAKLVEIEQERTPAQLADIIMANIHAIPQGSSKVKLFDFYTNEEVEVKLKADISAQKYAESLYKKAKKRPLELENLNKQIQAKEILIQKLKNDLEKLDAVETHKELEDLENEYKKSEVRVESVEKFKNYEVMGFQILVGRNADNNDELTQRFASKNDLWLHAKDVTGSHVVIKYQAGKNFPRPVIEAAAGLAAYYSKRKNETLCPVIYTEKKYVRKVKGAPKGAVKIEKESVIMVPPMDL